MGGLVREPAKKKSVGGGQTLVALVGAFSVITNLRMELFQALISTRYSRSEEMNYEKISRAMRYHYGSERQGRRGHLAMVKEKRLFYR